MYNNYTGDTVEDLFNKLDKLYDDYDNIVVMGHSYPDLDCYGASLGIYNRVCAMGKNCYVYLEGNNYSEIMNKAISSVSGVKYVNSSNIGNLTNLLLIIVDVHQVSRFENSNIFDYCKDYVILDHHIKDKKCPKNSKLLYINNNLSSMIELVTYYLDYSGVSIDSSVATIMLAGLEIDTNGYNLKTTSSTYKAASILVEMGADIIAKQELLKESKDDYVRRADYIKNSYTINGNIALCVLPDISKTETLAEIADSLLTFDNIEASFVIAKVNNKEYGISARSIGEYDILKVIRKLDGGGSTTSAGAKTNKSLSSIKSIIIKSIKG